MSGFLLAEFATAQATMTAAAAAAQAGIPAEDVLSPSPVAGIEAHLAPREKERPVGWAMVVAGVLGAAAGYFLQWYSAVVDYPIISGGRPLDSWPAFLIVPYEAAILSAAIVGTLSWMWFCGLPRPFHPLFAADAVERSSQDCYLLVFPRQEALRAQIEERLKPLAVHEVQG